MTLKLLGHVLSVGSCHAIMKHILFSVAHMKGCFELCWSCRLMHKEKTDFMLGYIQYTQKLLYSCEHCVNIAKGHWFEPKGHMLTKCTLCNALYVVLDKCVCAKCVNVNDTTNNSAILLHTP